MKRAVLYVLIAIALCGLIAWRASSSATLIVTVTDANGRVHTRTLNWTAIRYQGSTLTVSATSDGIFGDGFGP